MIKIKKEIIIILSLILVLSGCQYLTTGAGVPPYSECVSNEPTTVKGFEDEICSWTFDGWTSFLCKYTQGVIVESDIYGEIIHPNSLIISWSKGAGSGALDLQIMDFPATGFKGDDTPDTILLNDCNDYITYTGNGFCSKDKSKVIVISSTKAIMGEEISQYEQVLENKYFQTFYTCPEICLQFSPQVPCEQREECKDNGCTKEIISESEIIDGCTYPATFECIPIKECTTDSDCPQNVCFGMKCINNKCEQKEGTPAPPACSGENYYGELSSWKSYPDCKWICNPPEEKVCCKITPVIPNPTSSYKWTTKKYCNEKVIGASRIIVSDEKCEITNGEEKTFIQQYGLYLLIAGIIGFIIYFLSQKK